MSPLQFINGLPMWRICLNTQVVRSGAEECVHTYLEVGEEPVAILEYGIHAVGHSDRMLPVVVRNPPVVFLHRHNEATQLFQLKALWKRKCYESYIPGEDPGSDTHA